MLKKVLRTTLLLTAFFFLACAGVSERIMHRPDEAERAAESQEARRLLATLKEKNIDLKTFKGTGKFKFWQEGRTHSARLAWAGSYPDKLRIAVMSIAGQPSASFATDGEWLYLVSHTQQKFYKKHSPNPTLQKLISIPITTGDVIAVLLARVPIREHQTAAVVNDPSGGGYILSLKNQWQGVKEKIYFDSKKEKIERFEIFKGSNTLSYRVVFSEMRRVNGFEVPSIVIISDGQGNRFQLNIDKYWTDVPLTPSIFVLPPP